VEPGGLVVLPQFPDPRCEHAAGLITGVIDATKMTSWGMLNDGIDPYSLLDYCRYLNWSNFVAAVGRTDRIAATTAIGAIRCKTVNRRRIYVCDVEGGGQVGAYVRNIRPVERIRRE
jgi:hypothetical protein